jgi:ribonuclease-3
VSGDRAQRLAALLQRLGHRFADGALLERALTHASLVNETLDPELADNEPLEFLGDAVLGMLVAELLHRRDPEGSEGTKSRQRARLVSAANLARHAAALGVPELLRFGHGEERTGGRAKAALWANALEALVAALHLDGGLEAARDFVSGEFAADLDDDEQPLVDPKSALQELLQRDGRPLPRYTVVAEEGPSHRRSFRVECRLDDGTATVGEGHSKKTAERSAAALALARLEETNDHLNPRSSPRPDRPPPDRRRRPAPA